MIGSMQIEVIKWKEQGVISVRKQETKDLTIDFFCPHLLQTNNNQSTFHMPSPPSFFFFFLLLRFRTRCLR